MRFVLIYLLFFSFSIISQNFTYNIGQKNFEIRVKEDTAWVSEYHLHRLYQTLERRECLTIDPLKPHLLTSVYYKLEPKPYGYKFYYRKGPKKRYKSVKLTDDISQSDEAMLLGERTNYLFMLRDSLSGPQNSLPIDFDQITLPSKGDSLALTAYISTLDTSFNRLADQMDSLKNPTIDTLYQKIDSLKSISDVDIIQLLSTANFNFFYGKKLLYKLSKERPQVLINYIAKNPTNKKEVLRAVRWHPKAKEICAHIKATAGSSKAKRQIKRQYRVQKLAKVGASIAYISIIAAEIAAIVALVVLIT